MVGYEGMMDGSLVGRPLQLPSVAVLMERSDTGSLASTPAGLAEAAGALAGTPLLDAVDDDKKGGKRKPGDPTASAKKKPKKDTKASTGPDPYTVAAWVASGNAGPEEIVAPMGVPLPSPAEKGPTMPQRGAAYTALGVPMGGLVHASGIPDESWLRTRIRVMAQEHSLKKVAPDCTPVVSRALEQYLRSVVSHCVHLARGRRRERLDRLGGAAAEEDGDATVTARDLLGAMQVSTQKLGGERELQVETIHALVAEQCEREPGATGVGL